MFSLQDNYEHTSADIFYTEENIVGPTFHEDPESVSLNEQHSSQLTHHCKCLAPCTFANMCPCVNKFGGDNYRKIDHGGSRELGITFELRTSKLDKPVFECNSLCGCTERSCGNRLVQYGPRKHLAVETTNKGLGLFTNIFIPSHSFICEYAGEVISKAEAMKRHMQTKMNYIFCLNEHSLGRRVQTFVDPSVFGNIGRYINHSCEPNCCIVAVRVDSPLPKLAIFSKEDITIGTEITFDYGSCSVDGGKSNIRRTRCLCESEHCRQWLPCEDYS